MKKCSLFLIFFSQTILILISCAGDLEMRKRQSIASRNLGEAYMMQGKHTAALQELIKAQQLYPDDPYLCYDLGLVYMAKEKTDLAIVNFQKAIELKSDFSAAKNSLGTVYLVKEEWDKAIAVFKEVLEDLLYATPHYPLTNMGFAYFSKKDFKLAESYYLKALEKEPEYAVAWRGLGKTYISSNRISNSIEAFEKAVRISPTTAQLHMDLANAYKTNRNFKKAYESYMKVVELDPQGALGKEARKLAAGLK